MGYVPGAEIGFWGESRGAWCMSNMPMAPVECIGAWRQTSKEILPMTAQALAGLFTPPNAKLAAARRLILAALADEITKANQMAAVAGPLQRASYEQWRNGLSRAQYIIRDLVDSDGKVLRADLEGRGLRPEDIEALGQ